MKGHLTLYAMNKYKHSLDILDSLDYEPFEFKTRSKAHRYAPEMVSLTIFCNICRFTQIATD